MNDITSRYDDVKKEVPDPQVKDVADQFFDAAEILWVPGSGVLTDEGLAKSRFAVVILSPHFFSKQ